MSHSKNKYMGMHLKRVHRSEFDDNKLRELSRHDARLGVQMKTVDRARNVMLKSMDAEKQLFIKTGMQSNTRVTKSSQSPSTRQTSQPSAQRSRLVSDTRTKRSSLTEQRESDSITDNVVNSTSKSDKQKSDSTSDPNIETADNEGPPVFEPESVYDKFLERNVGKSTKSSNDNGNDTSPKVRSSYGASIISEASNNKTSNETPSVKNDQSKSVTVSTKNKRDGITKASANDKDVDQETSKRPTVWETLSTPKHTAMTRAKRNQVEREFTSSHQSKNKSMASSPSTPASKPTASGRVKSAGGQIISSHSASGTHHGRQPGGVKGKQLSSHKGRNDT